MTAKEHKGRQGNSFSRFAVENKRALIFTALLLSAIGFYLIYKIPEGVFPDATFPRIAVEVDYGLAPLKEMEMQVVKPIEEAAMMVEGVRTVRSSISRGSAEVNIDFQWNQDMFRAGYSISCHKACSSRCGALPPAPIPWPDTVLPPTN